MYFNTHLILYRLQFLFEIYNNNKQEAFRERRHLHVCDLWPWPFVKVKKALSLDVAFCIVPWYQVWWLWVYYFTRYHHLFILCDLWLSPVTFIVCQGHFHFNHYMFSMMLNVCTKNEVCSLGSIEFEIWTIDWRKLKWRHNDVITYLIFMKFKHKSTKGIFKQHFEFQFDKT